MDGCRMAKMAPEHLGQVLALSKKWEEEGITYGLVAGCAESFDELDVWTCLCGNRVIAYLSGAARVSRDMCVFPQGAAIFEVDELYVDPEWRSRGIGGELFRYVEEDVKASGAGYLLLSSATKDADRIRRFYVQMGMDIWTTVFFKKL